MKEPPEFTPDHPPEGIPGGVSAQQRASLIALLGRGLGAAPNAHQLDAFIQLYFARAVTLGIEPDAYLKLLELGGPEARNEWGVVAGAVVVGETFLFRDPDLWRRFGSTLLPSLKGLPPPLWIWSAGCATGEEAYTIAMVARRAVWPYPVRILATDVNPKAIAAARVGVYGKWSLRGVDMAWLEGSITAGPQTVRVNDDVKSLVRFELHNLMDDESYPPASMSSFGCIVCRNVLIYMNDAARSKLVRHFSALLAPGGLLILGHGESIGIAVPNLVPERYDEGVVFRKALQPAAQGRVALLESASRGRHAAASKTARRGVEKRERERAQTQSGAGAKRRESVALPTAAPAELQSARLLEAAIAAARRGDMTAAEHGASLAAAAQPLDSQPHVLLAALYAERGEFSAAERELRSALYLDPVNVGALWQIGNLYRMTKRHRQARFAFARALSGLVGLAPDQQALPLDSLTVAELTALLQAELDQRAEL